VFNASEWSITETGGEVQLSCVMKGR